MNFLPWRSEHDFGISFVWYGLEWGGGQLAVVVVGGWGGGGGWQLAVSF